MTAVVMTGAACSGSDHSQSGGAEVGPGPDGVVPSPPGASPTGIAPPSPTGAPTTGPDPNVPGRDQLPTEPAPAVVPSVCALRVAAFDLTKLNAAPSMAASVKTAWDQARGAATRPALALLFDQGGGDDASTPSARVGSVHPESLVDFTFDDVPSSADGMTFVGDPATHSVTIHGSPAAYSASFSGSTANGFKGAMFHATGVVDSSCNVFSGNVEIWIDGSSANTAFGTNGLTVAQIFGAPDLDTDGDQTADGWQLLLTGVAPHVEIRFQ